MNFLKKIGLTTLLIMLVTLGVNAQIQDGVIDDPGDIAFLGYNDSPDGFSFVFLDDCPNGTSIRFCDDEWTGTAFSSTTGEGEVLWTNNTGSTIAAGTVVDITDADDDSNIAATIGTASEDDLGFGTASTGGDQIFAFTGTRAAPGNFLAFVGGGSGYVFTNTGLTVGVTAVELNGEGYYNGTTVFNGTIAGCASTLNNVSNWTVANVGTYPDPYIPNELTGTVFASVSCSMTASISSQTNVACYGENDGALTVTASSGTANYSYAWSNGSTTSNTSSTSNGISSLTAGTYTVTVTDNNACTATASSTITQPSSAFVAHATVDSNVVCNGESNGGGTAYGTGGTTPYQFYSWNTGAFTASITGIPAGTYSVTITDANNCYDSASFTVVEPALLTAASIVDSNVTCNGNADGGATANATGGNSSYSYVWSNGATTASITGVTAGTYSVTVTDYKGCYDSASSTVTEPATMVAYAIVDSNASCNGFFDGGASASGTGGTGSYTYVWSNGATTASITGVTAGTYSVTVTDSKGCYDSASVTINEPALTVAYAIVDSNASCNGFLDGGATASGTGGTFPYTYVWSNGATTASITGVGAGTYSVTLTDSKGCYDSASVTVNEPALTVAYANIDSNTSCNGFLDGGATASGTGGTYPYTYVWSNGATTASITGVGAGTYSVTLTDSKGCYDSASVSINEPPLLVAYSMVDSNVTCAGYYNGGATASATGGTGPYYYAWSNAATTASITGIGAGTYTVTVTDNNGCTATSSSTVTQSSTIAANAVVDSNVTCNGFSDGGATASATGGSGPYTYAWSNSATTASITGVVAGTYTITVTDNNGCTASNSATVTEPALLVAAAVVDSNVTCNGLSDGGATASALGGTGPYYYTWSNAATTASITGVTAGTYSVTVTDSKGCYDSASVTVTEPVTLVSSASVDSDVSCNGGNDGQATASATGGTTAYSYVWSNGATTATVSSLSAGTYSVTITDAKGCYDSSSVTVTEPTVLVAASQVDSNVTCNGLFDGGATASASGGTSPYIYIWSNTATTASITGVAAGTYTVTVTDANGCTSTSSSTVTEPTVLVAASQVDSNVTCNGLSDGGATASASGGTSPYIYIWSNTATTASITGVVAGTYTVTVTDANGCTSTSSSTVTEPAVLVASSLVDSDVSCNGGSDGQVTASATGGTTAYAYAWSTGATTATVSSLSAGTYTVTVTDANGCTSTSSSTVTEPTVLVASSLVDSDVSCNGGSDGQMTASATGGTTAYSYAWSNGATTATASSLSAGTYTVTVTDANGCTSTSSSTVTEPTVLVVASQVDSTITCNGLSDGGATASATGGTSPYTYTWSNSATTASITGVAAGTYTVTVTDANGCTSTSSSTVTEPTVLVAASQVDSNVTCNGLSDGGATASASGGTSPYIYIWSNTATTASITGVAAGTYTVTVTDANGCTSTSSSTVTEPAVLVASSLVDSDVSCNGGSDGQATASATGGTTAYTYAWSTGATTATVSSLSAGTYTVTVTDANGCTSTSSSTVTEPTVLVAASQVDSTITCNGLSDGGATASATGGTSPYTYAWSNTATTASITGVAAGTYTVTVTDANGCTSTSSSTVTEPTVLVAASQVDSTITCNGLSDGGTTASATGGTSPYTYTWSNSATTASITGVAAGTYTVTVTDANGCTSTSSSTVTEPTVLVAASQVDSTITCNGLSDGGATASASGGTMPYTYTWSNSATTASITGVAAGTYTVTVTDANGCTSTSSSTVTEPTVLVAASQVDSNVTCNGLSDGGATASATGGTMPYTYAWSNSATTASITGVMAGTYTVTVTDANGCTSTSSSTVTEPATLVAVTQMDSAVSCNGLSDGGATASATGGTMPYVYTWSNGATTASITGVTAGTYSVTITDFNGCYDSASVTVTEPATLIAATMIDSTVSCNGLSDGGATSAAVGGTTPYTYIWSNGATTASITGVAAGTYSVTITDFNGCYDSASAVVTEPAVLVAASQVDSNVTCNGLLNGGATASATGGTMPYTYAWSNSATTASITGVAAGAYTVTVTDANGCTSTSSSTVTEPVALVASSIVDSNVTCNGLSDGGATASATGGTMPYTYAWSNSATTASITGVMAGTYTVTVTDANGCTSTSSSTVTEPATLVAATQIDSTVSCNGLSDGGATASATGGTMPYTYVWSNAATTASITGVAAGTYSVTITDFNGCYDSASVTITEPAVLVAASQVDSNVTCNGLLNGGATASATGGTMPYTYAWSNSATTASITGVAAGTYTVTITDDNGCFDVTSSTITEPTVLVTATVVDSNVTCNGFANGGATASATGGTTPYLYVWSNSATTASITGVTAGTYTVTITDDNGCMEIDSAVITEPSALMVTTTVDSNVTCNGLMDGGVSASVMGGTAPYTYLWSNSATTASITGLAADTFMVTVTDNNGCFVVATDTVTQPDVLAAAITIDSTVSCAGLSDGGATVTVTGGTMPYAYSWTNGDSTASITGVPADIYGVTVTDTNGCIAFAFDTVSQPAVLVISLDSVMDANCKGDSTGYASVSAMGGTMPYAYSWTSGDTGTTVSTLPEGTFTVTVMDSNNCSADTSFTIGYIHELPVVDLGDDVDTNIAEVTIALPDTFTTYLWSTGSDSNAITVYEKGTFSVIVTDSNGCSNSDSIYISLWPSSVVDRGDAGAGVSIYPNPTQGVFTLETINLNEERLDWMIVNINGQIIEQGVMNSNVQQQQIDLSESAQGVYFLIGKTSTNSFTTRIVVQ